MICSFTYISLKSQEHARPPCLTFITTDTTWLKLGEGELWLLITILSLPFTDKVKGNALSAAKKKKKEGTVLDFWQETTSHGSDLKCWLKPKLLPLIATTQIQSVQFCSDVTHRKASWQEAGCCGDSQRQTLPTKVTSRRKSNQCSDMGGESGTERQR